MAKRRTNLEWQSLFEQYESSSVTQRAFCEEHGLSLKVRDLNVSLPEQ